MQSRVFSTLTLCFCAFVSLLSVAQDQKPSPDAQKQIDDNAIKKSTAEAEAAEADAKKKQLDNEKEADDNAS